jgi:hypothetical protein
MLLFFGSIFDSRAQQADTAQVTPLELTEALYRASAATLLIAEAQGVELSPDGRVAAVRLRSDTHAQAHTQICSDTQTDVEAHTHTRAHAHTHAHTHTHTHTHTEVSLDGRVG